MMEFLAANWYWLGPAVGVLVPRLLQALNINLPLIHAPSPPATPASPSLPALPLPANLPALPMTMGHGELAKWLMLVAGQLLQQQQPPADQPKP